MINNCEFGIDYHCVQEILGFLKIDSISRNRLTSEIVSDKSKYTLVNIHGILEFPNVLFGSKTKLILIDIFAKKFGLIADSVIEIITTDKLFNEKTLDFVSPKELGQLFSGVLKFRNRKILILNLEKITCGFDRFIEFPRRLKTADHVSTEMKRKIKEIMGIH